MITGNVVSFDADPFLYEKAMQHYPKGAVVTSKDGHVLWRGHRSRVPARFAGLPCDDYDIKLVDEDRDVCVLEGVYLCGAEGESVLTDDELLDCQGW